MKLVDFLKQQTQDDTEISLEGLFLDEDTSVSREISSIVWEKMQDYPNHIELNGSRDISLYFSIMAKCAPFDYTKGEAEEVSGILTNAYRSSNPFIEEDTVFKRFEDIQSVNGQAELRFRWQDLGRMCFLACTLYGGIIEKRKTLHGGPNDSFYAAQCENAYAKIDFIEMAARIRPWITHVNDKIMLTEYVIIPD